MIDPITILLFIVGIAILLKGADFLVDGSSKIAKHLGVPRIIIGLTVVAFGTSLPEFGVAVIAALQGSQAISAGNIVGSNIANIGLVLGLSAMFYPIAVKQSAIKREIPIAILASLLVLLLSISGMVNAIAGLFLLICFAIFLTYSFHEARKGRLERLKELVEVVEEAEKGFMQKILGDGIHHHSTIVILGLIGIIIGSKWVVDSGVLIAQFFGISETIIGLTIVAIGTSLPELVTSLMAALKKEADIAIGNIVGSNIFNILLVLGFAAIITPINISGLFFDIVLMTIFAAVLLPFALHKNKLTRLQGAIFFVAYILYILSLTNPFL